MADRIKGITIEIAGDTTKLSQALSGVNGEIKTSQNQLKDVEKLLKLDPKNVTLLQQKQKLLNDTYDASKSKLATLKEAESQLKNAGVDQNSHQFMALQREIIATEREMQDCSAQAKANAKAIDESGDSADEAGAKHTGLKKALDVAGKGFGTMAAAAAAAAVATVKALTDCSLSAASYADDVLTTSTVTGIATDKLQEYAYAAELVDVSVDTLTGSMTKNIRAMDNARDGSEAYVEAYDKLGVSFMDANGNLRDSETVYWEVIDALAKVENETEADAIAMQLLGKSAQEVKPLIQAGSETLAELAEQANEVGYVMDEETLGKFGSLDDELQKLKTGATAAKNALGETLLPVLTDLASEGTDALSDVTQIVKESDGNIFNAIVGVVQYIAENLPTLIDGLLPMIIDAINGLVKSLPRIVKALIDVVLKIAVALADAIPELLPNIIDAIMQIVELITSADFIEKMIDVTIQVAWAIITGLVKSLPKLLSGVWNSITGFFKGKTGVDIEASVTEGEIPMMASGGVLTGGSAIVGEAGPELLTQRGNSAIVTPLTANVDTSGIVNAISAQHNVITINFGGSLAQLGHLLAPYITAEINRVGGTAFA